MVRIRTANELILGLLDYYRTTQPLLDTKPGTVSRDVLIDGPSTQLARLYDELSAISNLQSLRLSIGADLDALAQNFGATRQRGSKSTGPALLTFSELEADIAINKGDPVTSNSGVAFQVINSLVVSPVDVNTYRATASKYRADLDYVGITDTLAVEVLVEAASPGVQGNISKYSLNSTTIPGISNVTNASAYGGGRDVESDATFRNRVFAIFGGANTGTALGYKNAVMADTSVIDAIVIEPGDTLMTRDGTEVSIAEDGTRTIISEGTGGKVDVIIFGTRLQEVVDSYIYRDLSDTGTATHPDNDHVLGQIEGDEDKTVSRKRLDNLENGVLPNQPANDIIQVSGSLSGSNYVEREVDELGRESGNYQLIFDDGAYAGSPWGFDRLHWISDRISDFIEDKTKVTFNGQDPLAFTDLLEINLSQQNISVVNENAVVDRSDRTSLQLAHSPVTSVTRVFNVTTGERYIVASQNPDGTGATNETGRITIGGQTLPATSDILQVDYIWIFDYDPYFDFDGRMIDDNPREVRDSVDWGYSNAVRRERVILTSSGSFLLATVTHPISAVVSVNVFDEDSGVVTLVSGRSAVVVSKEVSSVISIVRLSDGSELWDTSDEDGSFNAQTIFLPTDSVAQFGDTVLVVYNAIDVYNADTEGSFNDNVISIVPSADATAGKIVECNYIANISTLLPSTLLPALPAIRSGNAFDLDTASNIGTQPTTHVYDAAGDIVSNLRRAPSNLALTISGSVSPGVITVSGTSITAVYDVIFTVAYDGLTQDLSSAIKTFLEISTSGSVPSNVSVARLISLERVTVASGLEVLSVNNTYDIKGYHLRDNSFVKDESIPDSSLTSTQIRLPDTPDNLDNEPEVGDRMRVRFYIITTDDSENVSFTKGGTLYTDKRYALVDTVVISSGFTSGASASATLTMANMNQPATRSRYKSFYDYEAPKANERITIRYNYDRLITDTTLLIEDARPVNADVLAKAATPILVDVTMNVVVTEPFANTTEIVRQNVQDVITNALNAQALGTIVDSSDLISAAYTVNGVDRARIMFFNRASEAGSVLSIEAQKNEYIVANNVTVNIETR